MVVYILNREPTLLNLEFVQLPWILVESLVEESEQKRRLLNPLHLLRLNSSPWWNYTNIYIKFSHSPVVTILLRV